MAHFVDVNDVDHLLTWNVCVRSGLKMPQRNHQKNYRPQMNSNGHFTTVDGVPVRKIFISNLNKNVSDQALLALFSPYGKVIEACVVRPTTPTPRQNTFGFVTYQTPDEATRALKNKHKFYIWQQKVFLSPADSWHQPIELPDGKLIFNRRHKRVVNSESESEEVESPPNPLILKPDDACAISKLNDDCLLLIFNCIPINERLELHLVCQRWYTLLTSMWFGLRKLDFTVPPFSNNVLTDTLLTDYVNLCPNITNINIATDDHKLTSNALIIIAKNCPYLQELTIRELVIKKRTLALLAKSCPELRAFYNDMCTNIPDSEMVGLLKYCRNLERIGVKFSPLPGGCWLKHLRNPLTSLSLEMYDFNPEHLIMGIHNSRFTLKELKFISCESIRSKDIEIIVSLVPELTHLTLAGTYSDFMPHSLLPITKLKNLTKLDLDNNSFVSDQLIEELAINCSELQTLSISGCDDRNLTLRGLGHLSKITGLTYLTLAGVHKVSDSLLRSISLKIKGLKHLGVMGCVGVTDEGCVSVVTNCKYLETFDVSGCGSVTNVTIVAAAESTRGTGRKLKIIAGDSGIDVEIACPPSIFLDPSSSIMSHYPSAMFILDSELDFENAVYNNLYDLNICEDLLEGSSDDDDSFFDDYGIYDFEDSSVEDHLVFF